MQGYHKNELFAEMKTSSIKVYLGKANFQRKLKYLFTIAKKKKRNKKLFSKK